MHGPDGRSTRHCGGHPEAPADDGAHVRTRIRRPETIDTSTLTPCAPDRVRRLRGAFGEDVPAARETQRGLLDGPARAVPFMVDGEPRYLVRGRLSAGVVHSALATPNDGGDPKGN